MSLDRRRFLAASLVQATTSSRTQDDWQGVGRVVAIGDIHGDKDALTAVLRMAGVIDSSENWIGGATHVVQVGDVPARGSQTRLCFDLLMRLETEAAKAQGRLHVLIGNHDAGVIYGDRRGVLPEEYAEFRTAQAENLLAEAWQVELETRRKTDRLPSGAAEVEKLRRAWLESHPPGFVEHTRAFAPNGPYGSWIRRNNVIIRINDTLFLHGGISPQFAARTRADLNATIRRELADPQRLIPGLTTNVLGPLWYRGFAEDDGPASENHLRTVLEFHGVKRIVIGHTVTRSAILPRFNNRVVNVDIGLSRFYGRPPACLIIEKGAMTVLHNGHRIPVTPDFLQYLKAVAAVDGDGSPVSKLIEQALSGIRNLRP
jgi:hypothetical protein